MGVAAKICPNCSAKNNPEFDECWKCQRSFLPRSEQARFWAESALIKLGLISWHILRVIGFLFFVWLCFFCWGLLSNVILGEMTTGQYVRKIGADLKQNQQTLQQAIRNEWKGPILETIGRLTSVGGNKPLKRYFGNGHLKSETPYKNGEREGIVKLYHENGRVRAEGFYKGGTLVGKVKEYYENGFLKTEEGKAETFERELST